MKIGLLVGRTAGWLALLLCAVSLFSDFLSPSQPEAQDLERFFVPPSRIHFVDTSGAFHWRPFVYRYELVQPLDVVYQERTDAMYPLECFTKGYPYRILGIIPSSTHLIGSRVEGVFHPWGTDELGRDVLARTLAGARTSLIVVLLGIGVYGLLGLAVGALAGLLGGWVDIVLMRLSEFVLALPALYLILALRALLPLRIPFWYTVLLTVGTIAAVTWPPMARGVRGLILQIRNAGYVEAARSLGCTQWQILTRHLLPALAPFAWAQAAVASPVFLLGEVILSFLNVGFQESGISWGAMLRNMRDTRVLTDFWWNLAPLAFVFVTLLCLNILGDRLQSARAEKAGGLPVKV